MSQLCPTISVPHVVRAYKRYLKIYKNYLSKVMSLTGGTDEFSLSHADDITLTSRRFYGKQQTAMAIMGRRHRLCGYAE